MSETWVAFLRGINLGKRSVKSPELKAAYEAMGFSDVRTLLASGNVIFSAQTRPDPRDLEAGFKATFGFESGTVLRSQAELRGLVAADPFAGRTEDADTKLYVTFLAEPPAKPVTPTALAGDFELVKQADRELFILAFRLPTGRFGAGMELMHKSLGKALWTSRNYNTVLKAAL
jgi:uncharacterized protein (DUF1697 family)